MNVSAPSATLASTLHQTRATARSLLGDRYPARMKELGHVLTTVAAKRKTSLVRTAQDMVRAADLSGFEAIQVLAAAVELTADPS